MKVEKVAFTAMGWDDYSYWLDEDKKIIKKIGALIKDIRRNGLLVGIGKPEPLKGNLSGWASRRITDEHRLVYRISEDSLEILGCRNHYSDK